MPVSPLLTVFGFLTSRATTVSTSDILFLLGLGLYLVLLFAGTTTTTEGDAIHEDILEVRFFTHTNILMMEKTDTGECHSNAVFVASHDNMIVANRATSLGNELYATLMGTLNVVAKGEESIRTQSHLRVLGNPLFLLSQGQHLGLLGEELLPGSVAQHVVVLVLRDVNVDGVVAIGTTDTLLERQAHHLRMLAQPPNISLVASQTGTVDTALLTSTDTDGLAVLDVADRV